MCTNQFFETYPNDILGLGKKDLFIYLIKQNVYIFIYCSLIFLNLFVICKQSSQINITILVSELKSEQKYECFQIGMSENGTIHISMMK